ncbi:anticodon binding domain protein [Mycobacterium kansasii]|uniref:Anticodon binding domain protein n=1 Tax=Mycobacterium kansasii TaxID=1768 RepID=A0A1V3XR55_MYCKA|nr:anticodon binding domain protein [Mycobacterium kansasii]
MPYLEEVAAQLKSYGVRVEVDGSDDRMAKKIVHHTNQKVPFMLLAGDRDVQAGRSASGSVIAPSSTACRGTRRWRRSWSGSRLAKTLLRRLDW